MDLSPPCAIEAETPARADRLSYGCSTVIAVTRAGRLDWQYRGDYIRTRSARRPGDTDIEPEWADEAFADDDALVDSPDPASKSGETDRLVGYSPTARMVIVVIYLRERLIGVNAWKANPTQARRYWEDRT
jgi:hypothetical protein